MTLTRSISRLRTEVNLLTTRATGEQRARLRLAAAALADAMDAGNLAADLSTAYHQAERACKTTPAEADELARKALDVDIGGGPNPACESEGSEQGVRQGEAATFGRSPHLAADMSAQRVQRIDDPGFNPEHYACVVCGGSRKTPLPTAFRVNTDGSQEAIRCTSPFHNGPDEETYRREHRYPPARPGDDGPLGGDRA